MNCTSRKMLAPEDQYPIVPTNHVQRTTARQHPVVPVKRKGILSDKNYPMVSANPISNNKAPANRKQRTSTNQYSMVPVNQTQRSSARRYPLAPVRKKKFALARKEYAIIPVGQPRKAIVIPRGAIFGIIPVLLSIFSVLSLVYGAWWYSSSASASESALANQYDCTVVNGISGAECNALVSLIQTNDSSGWLQGSGWLSNATPCQWNGVVCENGQVVELNLRFKRLDGSLSSEISNLTHLTKLDLFGNQLNGEIPAEIGNLSNLTHLFLHANQLSGAIPSQIGNLSRLKELWLHGNQLSGAIPPSIGQLSALEHLRLNSNQLSGSIPAEIGSLRHLSVFWTSDNSKLGGPLPSSFLSLPSLSYLYIFSTGICQPTNSDFQSWSNQLQSFLSDEITCAAVQEEVTEVLSADPVIEDVAVNPEPSTEMVVEGETASQETPAAPVVTEPQVAPAPQVAPVAAGNIQMTAFLFIPVVGDPTAHQLLANASDLGQQAGTQYDANTSTSAAVVELPTLAEMFFIPVVANN